MTMRSLAWVMMNAPAADARARMWNSTPLSRSRSSQSCATNADSRTLNAMTAVAITEKPSRTIACAIVVVGPDLSIQRHWKTVTTSTASDARTLIAVTTAFASGLGDSAVATSRSSDAPKKIRTGRIAR